MENISVSVRVRPLNSLEAEKGLAWKIDNNQILPSGPLISNDSNYTLDYVFGSESTTKGVYEQTTEDIIKKVVGGFNGTVFAYGQTSSGKTHTMRGTAEEPGIIPLAVAEIFGKIDSMQDREFLLRVSYMELYNEDIHDLLAHDSTKLQIHESKEAGVYVAGLREEIVTGADHVLELLSTGEAARHIGETKMNKASSRSHTVFRMVVESRSRDPESADGGAVWVSTLTLVDLAGSERIAKTGAEGLRMKEGASINKSLLTLGTVINKLSEGVQAQGGHIPYRDSKLTRILQPSLGGNAKTAIICNITPAVIHQEESHSTLRFACRAKRVVNNAMVNEVVSDAAVLKRQAKEIEELRKVLAGNGNTEIEAQIAALRAELLHKEQEHEIVQLQLTKEREDREKAERQVHGLTKLMLGHGSEGESKPRKENRRETWAPGLAGKGSRKRPLASQLESVMEDGKTGRRSELLSSRSVLSELDPATMSPAHQKQRSLGNINEAEGIAPLDLGNKMEIDDNASVSELQSRIKELETEQVLIQRELDSVSEAAQRADEQLRNAEDELCEVANERDQLAAERDQLVPQNKELAWQNRHLERQLQESKGLVEVLEQNKAELVTEYKAYQVQSSETAHESKQTTETLAAEILTLRASLESAEGKAQHAESALLRMSEDHKLALEKMVTKSESQEQELAAFQEKFRAAKTDSESSQSQLEDLQEKLEKAAERERDLYDTNKRLENHIQDLESRKRAPLYQKKQEEELRAQTEKAQEAEIRAAEADLKFKEAKIARHEAESQVGELQEKVQRLEKDMQLAAEESASNLANMAQKHDGEISNLTAAHQEKLNLLHANIASLTDEVNSSKQDIEQQTAENASRQAELLQQASELADKVQNLETSLNETQACADAASERIRGLEDEAEVQRTESESTLASAQQEKEAQKAALEEQMTRLADEKSAEIAALNAQLQEVQRALQEKQQEIEQERVRATQALEEASTQAVAEHEALHARFMDSEAIRAELEAKVARAAGALKAADDLKEAKRQHREEMMKIQQQLKASSASSKGGAVEAEKAKKELEKLREKLQGAEAKCRGLVQEKNQAVQEKGNFEREIKQLRGTTGRLTKDLEKRESAAEKKLESANTQIGQVKAQLSAAESTIARMQSDLDQTSSSLATCEGERDSLVANVKDLEVTKTELLADQAHKSQRISDLGSELESTHDKLANSEQAAEKLSQELMAMTATKEALDGEVSDLTTALEQVEVEKREVEGHLSSVRAELSDSQSACTARAAEVANLAKELEISSKELKEVRECSEARRQAEERELAELKSKIDQLQMQINEERASVGTLTEKLGTAEFQVQELEVQNAELQEQLVSQQKLSQSKEAESLKYQQELEGQLNEMELENQTYKASLEDLKSRFASATAKIQALSADLEDKEASLSSLEEKLAALSEDASHKLNALTSTESDLEAERGRLQNTEAELDTVNAQLQKSQAELEAKIEELQILQHAKSEMETTSESRLNEAINSAEQWKEFAEKLEINKAQLETSLKTASQSAESQTSQLEDLRTQVEEQDSKLAALNRKLTEKAAEAKAEEERLLTLLSEARMESEQAKTDALSEQSYLKEVTSQEILQLETKLATVEAALHECRSEAKRALRESQDSDSQKASDIAAIQEALNASERNLTEAQQDLNEKIAEIQKLQQCNTEGAECIHNLKQDIQEHEQKARSLQGSIAALESAKAAVELDLRHAQEGAQSDLCALQQEIEVLKANAGSEKNQALKDLKERHSTALRDEHSRATAVQAELNAQLQDISARLESESSVCQSLQKTCQEHLQQKEAAERQILSEKEKHSQAEAKLERLSSQCESWKSKAQELQSDLAMLKAEVQRIPDMQSHLVSMEEAKNEAEEQVQLLMTEITVLKGETARLRTQLDYTNPLTSNSQATPAQLAAERKVAELHGKLHSHESKIRHLTEELSRIKAQPASSSQEGSICSKCPSLESELRKCKRAQEKMTAIQFRLRKDIEAAGGDLNKLEQHKSVVQLEYELDFQKNRFKKELQALQKEGSKRKAGVSTRSALAEKENYSVSSDSVLN